MAVEHVIQAIWVGGAIHAAIVLANIPLPGRLQVRKHLAAAPLFMRQIFYVHWLYIVIVVGLFGALSFAFASELAGASRLGTFLSATIALFWLLRVVLQWLYYDPEIRRQNRALDLLYGMSLIALVGTYGFAAVRGLTGGL